MHKLPTALTKYAISVNIIILRQVTIAGFMERLTIVQFVEPVATEVDNGPARDSLPESTFSYVG